MWLWDMMRSFFGMLPGVDAALNEDKEIRWEEKLLAEKRRVGRVEQEAKIARRNAERAEKAAKAVGKELLSARQANGQLKSKENWQAKEMDRLKGQIVKYKEALAGKDRLAKALEKANENLRQCQRELTGARQTVKERDNEISGLRTTLQDNKTLLDIRAAELRVAQTYLSKVDPISHADVLDMLQRLNSEIFQLSAQMADDFSFEGQGLPACAQEHYGRAQAMIGSGMATFLTWTQCEENSAYVQMGLQAAISHRVMRFIGWWNLSTDENSNLTLGRIYQRMIANEATTVCEKWRALALHYLALEHEEDPSSQLQPYLLQALCDILLISSVTAQPTALLHQLKQSYGDKISDILRLADTFRKATKEDVISTDYRLALPHYDETFIDDSMEDAERRGNTINAKSAVEQKVLCSTELGLWRFERSVGKDGSPEGVVEMLMLKPKVVLVSFVEELSCARISVGAGAA